MGGYISTAMEQAAYRAWAAGHVIPDRITTALDAKALYGPEVDLACGVEEPAVDEWEAGTRYPTWEQLRALAELCEVTTSMFTAEPISTFTSVIICDRSKRKNGCQVVTRTPILAFTPEAIAAANLPKPPPPPTGRRRIRRAA